VPDINRTTRCGEKWGYRGKFVRKTQFRLDRFPKIGKREYAAPRARVFAVRHRHKNFAAEWLSAICFPGERIADVESSRGDGRR
jgi:hypothetical protein